MLIPCPSVNPQCQDSFFIHLPSSIMPPISAPLQQPHPPQTIGDFVNDDVYIEFVDLFRSPGFPTRPPDELRPAEYGYPSPWWHEGAFSWSLLIWKEYGCECVDFDQMWYKDGQLHRENEPALISSLSTEIEWYWNGKHHRWDGPAVDTKEDDNDEYRHFIWSWHLFGKQMTQDQHWELVDQLDAAQRLAARLFRTRKARKFVKLCRSREFNEMWYAPGGIGRTWDIKRLEGMTFVKRARKE